MAEDRGSKRLEFIAKEFGEALIRKMRERLMFDLRIPVPLTAESVVELFSRHDPTRNQSATQWIVQSYLRQPFLLEDLPKVCETLTDFGHVRSRLPVEQRDLGRYEGLSDLWDVVKPFVAADAVDDTPSGREIRRRDRAKAHDESIILHEDEDGFTIAVPMTEFAAKWWGKGTRWCTAGEKGNAFHEYHQINPLIVIIMPGGDKLQLHPGHTELEEEFDPQTFQFMNADDRKVRSEYVLRNWGRLAPIMGWLADVTRDLPDVLCELDDRDWFAERFRRGLPFAERDHLHDPETLLAALDHDHRALEFYSGELDYDTCLKAMAKAGQYLHRVPLDFRDDAMASTALASSGLALMGLPGRMATEDVVLAAVRRTPAAICEVPSDVLRKHPDLCREAVRRDGLLLREIPEEFVDRELCLDAVRQNAAIIRYVPGRFIDDEILMEAVKGCPDSAVFHRSKMKREHWIEAVRSGSPSIFHKGHRLEDDAEFMIAAAIADGWRLKAVPRSKLTRSICLEVATKHPVALQFVPEEFLDPVFMDAVLSAQPWSLSVKENLERVTRLGLVTDGMIADCIRREPGLHSYLPSDVASRFPAVPSKVKWTPGILDRLREDIEAWHRAEIDRCVTPTGPF